MPDHQLDRFSQQALQQVRDFGDHVRQLQHLRSERLLAREGEQLAGQACRAVGVGADLLDVVIIAVAGRVTHQHQITMTDNSGQYVVEIMGDTAGQLADGLHLGCLCDLALEA